MNIDDYQEKAISFALYPDRYEKLGLAYTALGLAGEAGEFAEKVKKLLRDGTFNHELAAKELGDVLWYVANAANEMGYNLDTIARMNIDKLSSRKERGVLQGSGDTR